MWSRRSDDGLAVWERGWAGAGVLSAGADLSAAPLVPVSQLIRLLRIPGRVAACTATGAAAGCETGAGCGGVMPLTRASGRDLASRDRKSGGEGKSVAVRGESG